MDPLDPSDRAAARRLARGLLALVGVTVGLMVLGALVRAHGAGLACPDWPLCFGELIPAMDFQVAFEWTHRAVAGGVALAFAGLAAAVLRRPPLRRTAGPPLVLAGVLLALQVLLGALTVWHLLAVWTVTAHLVTANAFAVATLVGALRLAERADPTPPRPPVSRGLRGLLAGAGALLAAQIVLGGLVSSAYAGLVCPDWPACAGNVWIPPDASPSVALHLLHRWNAVALLGALLAAAAAARRAPGVAVPTALAAGLAVIQVGVGVANVLLRLPVEITGLHSAIAAALVLTTAVALRAAWARPVSATRPAVPLAKFQRAG